MFARKMQIFVIFLLLSHLCHQNRHQTYAYINIQIEPEDIQNVADIFMQFQPSYPQSGNFHIKRLCKSFSRNILQMMGIMLTLVGANVITSMLEPFSVVQKVSEISGVANITAHKLVPSELCKSDYGCDENICWRTCDEEKDGEKIISQSWCYTSSKKNKMEYQKCNFSYECSPCWDCLTSCKPV